MIKHTVTISVMVPKAVVCVLEVIATKSFATSILLTFWAAAPVTEVIAFRVVATLQAAGSKEDAPVMAVFAISTPVIKNHQAKKAVVHAREVAVIKVNAI